MTQQEARFAIRASENVSSSCRGAYRVVDLCLHELLSGSIKRLRNVGKLDVGSATESHPPPHRESRLDRPESQFQVVA